MTNEQISAWKVATGGIADPAIISKICIAALIAVLFLWVSWGLYSIYKGYAAGDVPERAVLFFVLRCIALTLITLYFFT